jgi:hypothetical protein
MPCVTCHLSSELYRHARLAAARRNMSISALLRAVLVTIDQQPAEDRPDGKEFHESFHPLPNPGILEEKIAQLNEHTANEHTVAICEERNIPAMLDLLRSHGIAVPPLEFFQPWIPDADEFFSPPE